MWQDITMKKNHGLMLSAQMFFRPEDIQREKDEDSSSPIGARELFLSFHKSEVAAEAAMHKCTVHVLPGQYPLPPRRMYPGFIAQEVYDVNSKKLFKLDNKDFAPDMLQEIDLLVQKTMCHLGIYRGGGYESDQEDQAATGMPK